MSLNDAWHAPKNPRTGRVTWLQAADSAQRVRVAAFIFIDLFGDVFAVPRDPGGAPAVAAMTG